MELATRLAEKADLSKADAIRAVEGFMEAMADAFAEKESIYMRGFGTFKIVVRAEKKARHSCGVMANFCGRSDFGICTTRHGSFLIRRMPLS